MKRSTKTSSAFLARDLAGLYGATTSNLNKAVRRNLDRFPADFMFQLTSEDAKALRFQFGTLKRGQHFGFHVKEESAPYRVVRKSMRN